jgi:hypothetical protein
MVDTNYKKVKEGQKATVQHYGHILNVEIYEVENDQVFFRTIAPNIGQPQNGYFNIIETQRYLTVMNV